MSDLIHHIERHPQPRKTEFRVGDSFSPERDLRLWDQVTIEDDKGRLFIFRVGNMTDEPAHDFSNGQTKISLRMAEVLRLDGVDLKKVELIIPGIFPLMGDTVDCFPRRAAEGQEHHNDRELIVKLNPFKLYRVRPHHIHINANEIGAVDHFSEGDTIMFSAFQVGDLVTITDYKHRQSQFRVASLRELRFHRGYTEQKTRQVLVVEDFRSLGDRNLANALTDFYSVIQERGYKGLGLVTVAEPHEKQDDSITLVESYPRGVPGSRMHLGFITSDGRIEVADMLSDLPRYQIAPHSLTIQRR